MSRTFCLRSVILLRFTGLLLGLSLSATGCMSAYKKSVGGDLEQEYTRVYWTDLNTAWQAALEALKSSPLDIANRESGYIQTKWVDNTADKNFTESFGQGEFYLKAQYRFLVTVASGYYNGKPSVKVTVRKEQLVQYDVLEGWKPVSQEPYEENTLLYRIERIVYILQQLAKMEEEKTRKEVEKTQF